MRQYFIEEATPEVQDHVDHAVAKLIEAGAAVEEVRIPIDMHAGREAHGFVQNAEAADAHEADFAAHADDYMPTTRGVIENGMAVPVTKYIQAQALRRDLRRELLQAVETLRRDPHALDPRARARHVHHRQPRMPVGMDDRRLPRHIHTRPASARTASPSASS